MKRHRKIDKIPTETVLSVFGTPPDATDVQVKIGLNMSEVSYTVPLVDALRPIPKAVEAEPEETEESESEEKPKPRRRRKA